MKAFYPSKIYRMKDTQGDYQFVGYYFRATEPDNYNDVVIGEDNNPVLFVNASYTNIEFDPSVVRPMHEVVAKKYHVAYVSVGDSAGQWVISDNTYATIESFYSVNSRVQKSAYLLVD